MLYTKKVNHSANMVLAAAIFALSLDIFHSVYIIFEHYFNYPHLIGITYAFPFLYGPIFYLYVKFLSSSTSVKNKKVYAHFIPFVLAIIYGLLFVYFESAEFKLALVKREVEEPFIGLLILDYLKPIHGILYVIFTIRVVVQFNNKIKNTFSNIEEINLNWLRYLVIGLSILWFIVIISYAADLIFKREMEFDHLIYLSASILIYTIGYLSLKQPQILTQVGNDNGVNNKTVDEKDKEEIKSYKKSGLSEAEAKEYLDKLLNVIETEKPYLNNDLTLQELATMVSISTHNLSEVINTKLNRNFYDFINGYRVQEVQKRLEGKDSEIYSLLAIALESGFNSKSSFNTTFKKHTGITPSQYRNKSKN